MNIKKLEIKLEYVEPEGSAEKKWVLSLICRQVPDKEDRKFQVAVWDQKDYDVITNTVDVIKRTVDIINVFDNDIILGDDNLCTCDWCHELKHHVVEIVEKVKK